MTRTVAILGYPLGHSLSPVFQQAAFDFYGLDLRYEAWPTPPDDLKAAVARLRQPEVMGANVTVPHKESIRPLLDRIDDWARAIGAVNTVVNQSGLLSGHNTDAQGFLRALRDDAGFDPRGKAVLILGAGGSARAVAFALIQEKVASITIANRTLERARALASSFGTERGDVKAILISPSALTKVTSKADLIVNCTSLGMKHGPGEGETPVKAEEIPQAALVYDLVYNPSETPLLKEADKAGAHLLGGLPMLIYQGAASFKLWTGREAPVEVMMKAARSRLSDS
ncbi:MAG: shikimate dehydrogenase [Chloroflexi bacterium]|nr:shikimate dehydrogenase [Chloroflexota bacterium]